MAGGIPAAMSALRSCGVRTILLRPCTVEGLPRVLGGTGVVQIATLKATHGEKYPYAEPYPYWKKPYNVFARFFDKSIPRYNENTKVIVVEGNVAVGKKEFAQHLAREFDLKYIGPTTDSRIFTCNDYNWDQRELDPMLPEGAKGYDLKRFYADKHPEKGTVGRLLLAWLEFKFYDYCFALKHVLNTGQGVVMVRSVYSDIVFVDALRRMGYVTAPFVQYYNAVRDSSICELLKPHMTIYLDSPINVIRDRITQRNDPREVGSKVLSDKYLQAIADVYRDKFLPKMKQSGEVVEIDWTEKGTDVDMDVIAEELQLYNLEQQDNEDSKFADWSRMVEDDWMTLRMFVENEEEQNSLFITPLPWDCPEVMFTADDATAYHRIASEHPVWKYKQGWAPTLGHGTLFKIGS
jgi:NADH dehydrogenase (ubiquinone) 1 alpha subcomplex subunit 10